MQDAPPSGFLASTERLDRRRHLSKYHATLEGLRFPVVGQWVFVLISGLSLGLVGAPALMAMWVAVSMVADWILQTVYRRWSEGGEDISESVGLRRLALASGARSLLWVAAPTALYLITRQPAALIVLALTGLGLAALAVSSGWMSRLQFVAKGGPTVVAFAIVSVATMPPLHMLAAAIAILSATATLTIVMFATHAAVGAWRTSDAAVQENMDTLRDALERSEAAERRLSIAVDLAKLFVSDIDFQAKTIATQGEVNAPFETPLSFEALWDDPYLLVHADDQAQARELMQRAMAEASPYKFEHRLKRRDGSTVWVDSAAHMQVDGQGRPTRMVGAMRDVTQRRLSEEQLQQALSAAEAANLAKSEFLAVMSHEVRTPLNGVMGMVQAMGRDDLSLVQRERLEVIHNSATSLLGLLNGILDIAKIEAGKLDLELAELDLETLARRTVEAFAATAAETGVSLGLEVTPSAAGVYRGDAARIGQVLTNLVSNAVKFSPGGEVSVLIDRRDELVRIEVVDTGEGFNADAATGLFEKFAQADASITRRFGGTGLGLTIVKELAGLMGGEVAAAGAPGEGARFTVSLPLERLRDADAVEAADVERTTGDFAPATTARVLVAEDNPTNRLVIRTLLNQLGIEPKLVADGDEAIEAWKVDAWDLILMDVQMPRLDGPAATREIRRLERERGLRHTPIVALTANVMSHQVGAYVAAGMDAVLAKPIDVASLFQILEQCLGDSDAAQPELLPPG